jgi:hypothetical protein
MGIHANTRIQAYQLKAGGTCARMAILRMIAADSANNANELTRLHPGDWRKARVTTLAGYEAYFGTLSQGRNDDGPIWYSFCEGYFRRETTCAELLGRNYQGYYADEFGTTVSGIVASLTHGRFIAGYTNSETGERVYYGDIYSDEHECARMADEIARVVAEKEYEYNERWRAAQDLSDAAQEARESIRELWSARHNRAVRKLIHEHVTTVRDSQIQLTNEYSDIEV